MASAPAAATSPDTALEGTVVTRTTWWPRDLDAALDDDVEEEAAAYLARTDGHTAFYPARVNGIIGPSESGKTWVALHAVEQAVDAQLRITIIDLEDSDRGVTARLRAAGVTPQQIRDHVRYINPEEPFHPVLPTGIDLMEHLAQWQPHLVILDGFNAAMTLQGLDLLSNKDATAFMQTVLKPIAKAGPAVVYVDHTPKDKEHGTNGAIGAQAKRAMTDGCTLRVEVTQAFGKGQNGRLRLHVDKDRLGAVRGVSAPGKAGHWFGDLVLTSNGDTGAVHMQVDPPGNYDVDTREVHTFRPTLLMERVSSWLVDHPGAGRNEILTMVPGRKQHLTTALSVLVDEGHVTVTKQGQKSLHTVARPFTEALDGLIPPTGVPGVPPGSRTPDTQLGSHWGPTGVPDPGNTTGVPGVPLGGTKYPLSPDPSATPPSTNLFAPEAGPRIVRRVVAGNQVLVNLDNGHIIERDEQTGALIDTTTGEVIDDGPHR